MKDTSWEIGAAVFLLIWGVAFVIGSVLIGAFFSYVNKDKPSEKESQFEDGWEDDNHIYY